MKQSAAPSASSAPSAPSVLCPALTKQGTPCRRVRLPKGFCLAHGGGAATVDDKNSDSVDTSLGAE